MEDARQLSEADVLPKFPISELLEGWYFRVDEVSAGVYRVEGTDLLRRWVSLTGTDSDLLLRQAAAAASEFGGGYMTVAQVYAWIFLSVREPLGSLQDILGVADAINHAIPSHRELQGALGWLVDQGLVRKNGRRYALTEEGSALHARCSKRTIMASLEAVAARFSPMLGPVAPPDDVTEGEVDSAYKGYRKWFSSVLKKPRR